MLQNIYYLALDVKNYKDFLVFYLTKNCPILMISSFGGLF